MKQIALSIEQMKHLKKLGVDTSKASMVRVFTDDNNNILEWDELTHEYAEHGDACGYFYRDEDENLQQAYESLLCADGNYDHSYRKDCGAFSLQDILEILPKMIKVGELYYDLSSDFHNSIVYKVDWDACDEDILHEDDIYLHTESDGSDILKMAYKMLCWVAENVYLEQKTHRR